MHISPERQAATEFQQDARRMAANAREAMRLGMPLLASEYQRIAALQYRRARVAMDFVRASETNE